MSEKYAWWPSLKHGGLLIAPARLSQFFPETAEPLAQRQVDQLRRDVLRVRDGDSRHLGLLLDTVLEEILQLDRRLWFKGSNVDTSWSHKAITGETIRPRRVWANGAGHALPVFVADGTGRGEVFTRIGVGRGRRAVSRVIEWLRKANRKVALLTNGRQWRLIHAGADYDAWAEWDTDLWFEEGKPGPQVEALRLLLGASAWESEKADDVPPLLAAIQASRQGQAELSAILGERVRQAVELLIRESAVSLGNIKEQVPTRDIYIAANRIIMRCVIILFAEARDLLPRDNTIYHESYGIQGLREQLERLAGGRPQERLRHGYSAWPRLLALFRLVYEGSSHEALPIPAYGGRLFAPGDPEARDAVRRALVAFEDAAHGPSDAAVYWILELLTRSKIKVRQGNRNTWVDAPIDFSDLSSEYIGILYQGLLDFELRQAAADEPMIFLNLGDQPVLPLTRLEAMDDAALSALVDKLRQGSRPVVASEDDGEEDEEEAEAEEEESEEEADDEAPADEGDDTDDDVTRQVRERANAWAAKAVKAGNLITKPRSRSQAALAEYETSVQEMAPSLIARVVLPNEWFLVRWGGTRKGSGTFYTRPQLGVPLVQRTLRPLAYNPHPDDPEQWIPKTPEVILALKVCDSAMGSGSLLAAALRFLTDALYESLYYHGRIEAHGENTLCRLADGNGTNTLLEETLPLPPDHPELEDRLKARLKRYVAERCIYGVDYDPLAVELAKLSLWIETMDSSLPFGFLDHKLKYGNSLVGCWFDRFQDYPVMAWERDGGDQNHDRFVHHFREYVPRGKKEPLRKGDKWTQAIKDMRNDVIKPQMVTWITAQQNVMFDFAREGYTAEGLHDEALAVFAEMNSIPVHETGRKADLYREKIQDNPALHKLNLALDTWCAIWFWPGDQLDLAPTPANFQNLSAEARRIVEQVAAEHRFFHWELEFPDVFTGDNPGFDAMIQNPPWDILKPKSQEFFSNIDPLYRTYGKQEALANQQGYFEQSPNIEQEWLQYNARFRALSNWCKHVTFPFGDEAEGGDKFSFTRSTAENGRLHQAWRARRAKCRGYTDREHPFRHQGSADINAYKMFLELGHALLCDNGYMGFIVPSGIASDKGTTTLRTLFLDRCRWHWLFGFENREKIFEIDSRFKFFCLIVQKGGQTSSVQTAFMRRPLSNWEEAEQYALAYPREWVVKFSPFSRVFVEIQTRRELDVLQRMYSSSVLLGYSGEGSWLLEYATEFHTTNDSRLFPPRSLWEQKKYRPSEYGLWLKGKWQTYQDGQERNIRPGIARTPDDTAYISIGDIEDVALPLYEGRMIGQLDFSQKGWVSGRGRSAIWREIPPEEKVIEPQFLMALDVLRDSPKSYPHPKVAYILNPKN